MKRQKYTDEMKAEAIKWVVEEGHRQSEVAER